ncbi:MAG: ATP-binding protein [Calditrichaeota bacterium]|nr:ATP-binding protein [Calditrichota bacterium]
MSFKEETHFTMVASRERQHGDRIARLNKYQLRVLPMAAIYGGNASGKTNLFRALNFAKYLVVKGSQPDSLIPVEPFRLGAKGKANPTHFHFELLIDENIYGFSFTVDAHSILEEKLVLVTSTSERVLYHRQNGNAEFDEKLAGNEFLKFAFQGTRENQLFLTNSVSQNVDIFKPVYDWFKNNLELVAPDSRFESFEQFLDEENPLFTTMNEMLPLLDTGITRLGGEEVPFENLPLPTALKTKLQEEVKEGKTFRIMSDDRFVVTRKKGKLLAKKLVTYHQSADGGEVKFEINQESDGSKRVLDLLPAFLDLFTRDTKKVYVIDEVGRSLHTLLIRKLLNAYLNGCSAATRSQLLLTTHDVLLMDQQLLRRDEMWVTERDASGQSNLFSFSEYKDVRYDKDIRKSYLQGRLGGIPRIFFEGRFSGAALEGEMLENG